MKPPYPVATMRRTVELVEARWTPTQVRRLLADEGHRVPSLTTIYLWTNEEYRERHNRKTRRRAARRATAASSFRWPANRSVEWRLGRMAALRATGLGYEAISKVMTLDFPDEPLTFRQVEGALKEGRMPRPLREMAA